ncbi:MAG: efflux RND transporter periplasmic adaptor subunit [Acidobacteria bacterium]|nr:efflux RND transporter periplasmic adaptor subunit [Acidobacteriota bacterium]
MKIFSISVMTLALLAIVGCSTGRGVTSSSSNEPSDKAVSPDLITVSVAKPERRTVTDGLSLTGAIMPYEQVTVYAKTAGYLKWIKVDMGDWVKPGDVLAEIDVPEVVAGLEEKRAAIVKAEADVVQARAALEQSRADLEFQEINYKRLKAIHDKDPDVLPEQEVDQARGSFGVASGKLKTAEAHVEVAEAAVATAKAALATLNTLMDYARITAPMAGVVTERFIDPGALVQAASSSRTQAAPVVSIARLDRLRVLVDVPEPKVRACQRGTNAKVQVDANPGEAFPARVSRTGGVLDPGSRTMRVEIDVPNPGYRLRPGMVARVELELEKIDQAVTVPVSAVRPQGKDRAVFLVEAGKAKLRTVRTGLESPEWIQIVEGLKGGEQVITASAGTLTDGAGVRVNQ